MFLKFNLSVKKLVAFVLTSLFFMQQIMILPAFAESNISGVANGQSGSFDIHPDFANGDFGFKHYGNFELGKGDVANLIFALKNGDISVDKFVNLVDNRIIINGVLNGILKNGDIGGHAIFVSPNGMAVGASGVINVGSLTAIAPTQQAYLKYIKDSAIGFALPEGYTHENNLAVLKASDMGSDITVNGKIIARGDVNLVAQTVKVGNTADNKAGILAGVDNAAVTNAGQKVNERLATTEAAGKLFDALVNNKVQNGTGFTKDVNGNIVIQAQSIKTVVAPTLGDKLVIAGQEFVLEKLSGPLVDDYGNVLDTNLLPKELRDLGITSENVQSALETYVRDSIPSDATNPNAHNDTNFAKVDINNAVLKGNNVDISATSKADYIAQKDGTTLFDSAYSSAIGQIIEGAVTGEGFDFEGARAKAEVVIGSGADIIADNDVNINSLAVANTSIKTGTRYTPVIDSGQEYYYTLGSKTISTINVNDGAKITAGNDVNIHAQSQNSHNIKLKNPTSAAGQLVGGYTGIPTIQVLLLKSTLDAQTSALVNSGAIINAANVEVDAVNVSSDLSNINSIASIGKDNGGIAVAVTLKDTNINTTAKIDTTVNTNGDGNVSINAQNLHMASNTSQATVDPKDPKLRMGDKFKFKILNLIADKLSGVIDTNILGSVSDLAPNVSTALVVNDSNITTTAKIGANANIHADNVSVNANTVDLTVNTTKAHVKDGDSKASGSGASGGVGDYIPNPGVAVIVNNQNNNTTAVIEDGTAKNHAANVTADNKLSVNATTELPRNNATFDLILNVIQAAGDIEDLPEDIKGNVNAELGKGDQWDIRLLLQGLTNPAAEIGSEISDIKFGIKNGGIKNNLGLQGFFNNWAETTSSAGSGIGIAASVIVSDVVNNTVARIGNNSVINAGDVIVNAANQVVQYNAAGDVEKLWKITGGSSGAKSGVGGNVIVENVESNARAQVGDGAVINVTENAIGTTGNKTNGDINIQAANQQDFLTAVVTGSKATGDNGVAISGSVTVQNVGGTTEASVGASKVNASALNIKAGEAQLATAQNSEGYLFHETVPKKDENGNIVYDEYGDPVYEESNPFEDLNAEDYEVGLDPDLTSPQISNYMGVDLDTGLLVLNEASTIKDGISNILIAGAIASESAKVSGSEGSGSSSSSGGAVGASVNVSQFDRDVKASIADGAVVNLTKDLNVISDSYTQSIDVAIAGAFAGGVKLSKKEDKKDTDSSFAGNKLAESNPLFSKVSGLFDKVSGKLGSTEAPVGSDANPDVNVNGNSYKADADGVYKDANGNNLTASDGNSKNDVKFQGSTGKEAANLDNLSSKNGQSKNISVAAAGSVNVQLNESSVTSEVGNAQITVGKDVNVKANQTTKSLNIGGGIAKAATVGAGAAVNFVENINETKASLKGTDITFKGSDNKLNVKAEENNDNVQVAIGVGVAKASQDDTTTQVSAGGSFNTDILENKVNAQIDGAKVKHESEADTIAVDVNAENHSTSYKGAGGMSVNTGSSGTGTGTGVGAGMGGNLNLITKETTAKITTNSQINNTKSVSVAANKDKTQKTEDLISVGVGGSVIASTANGYSFSGAMATDVINNTINATIDNSTVNSTGDVDVVANNNFNNRNLAGALSFSSASKGAGVGAGAIVSVINNNVNASIANNSTITAKDVNVNADNNENLQFLAANMGIQTGAGIPISANGIVNVIQNNISASVSDSYITNSGTLDIISDYDTSIEGITVGVAATSEGEFSVGANVLSNTLLSSNTAQLINSVTTSDGKLTVKATTDGNIDAIPAAAAITASGSAAAAANVGVNVVQNSTTAKIDGTNTKKSTVSANGIEVSASDNTQSRSRGGVLAASGGTAAVGGSILADVYIKNVDAHIDNTTVTKGGDIKVEASAKNIFGEETPGSVTASALVDKITGDYDMSNDTDYQNWDMTFDVAGASTAGVSGSLISKNVINDVDAYIGSNVAIQKAGNIDVLASNKTVADVIVGSITAGGTAAVGGSIFSNVNVSTVDAGIKNGAQVGSDSSRVGYVNVNANSEQIYKSMMAIVGGAGTAAVKGSINSNIIVNETNAYVGNGVNIFADRLNVAAADSMDTEALNVAVSAAGSAAVGGAVFTNVLANKVNSTVGKDGTDGQKSGNINTTGDVNVSANDDQNFQGNVLVTSAAGAAGVGAVAIANVMASEVNAGIENTTVTSNNGSVTISANNSFNGDHKDQNTGLQSLIDNGSVSSDDISNLIPLVGVITIGAAGSAGVSATLIANVVTTTVNAYVDNSTISTLNGLSVDADSSMTTYDAALSVAAAGVAGVGVNGVTNIYSGTTIASVTDSTVNGSLNVTADDAFNLNTIIFTTAASGTAAVTAITNVNTISNEVTAKVEDSKIKNAQTVDVDAHNTVKTTDVLAAGAVAGTGAGVNVAPIVNVFTNDTNAYIKGGSINNAATTVDAGSDIAVTSAILGVSGSGIGAAVSGFAGVNVFDNDLNAYILGTEITNAISTSVTSNAKLDLDGIIGAVAINGVGASVLVNGIVNVIKNNVNAYIADSSIQGGSVSVNASQNTIIDNDTASVAGNGVGVAASLNLLVSVLTNNLNAYITNTSAQNMSTVTVAADNKQNIDNVNIGVVASGTAAAGANTTVNVIENTTRAVIDAKDKTINASSGKVSVVASDEILLNNTMGLVAGSGFGSGAANVNVNVINNALQAELLSSTGGKVNADSVEVASNSVIGIDEGGIAAAAAGVAGIAGTVFVTSIGGKVDFSGDSNLNEAGIDDSITQANTNFGEIVNGITYEKDGQTLSLAGSYDLTQGDVKGGTQADINANVNTTGADGVKVSANNTLKGYDSDTMNITNATASAGTVAAGVGVLVTDMKYNTSASISGGNVVAQNNGDVTVKADSNVKANTDAVATTLTALVGVAGSVAYFDNKANTTAQIINANVNSANDINVLAESSDSIVSKAISASVGGVSVNLNIAVANTENTIQSLISGNNVDIDADNLNVKATNTSRLESELYGASIAGVDVSVVVNTAVSKAVSEALISLNNNSTVDVLNDLNIISQTGGINTINNVVVGSVGVYSADGNYQKAESNATFNSGITGGKISANNVKINAGTAKDSDEGGNITATVNTKKATGAFYSAGVTVVDARANGNATAKVTGGNVSANNNIDLKSKLNRTANIDSDSFSAGLVDINALAVSTSTGGDTNINTNDSTLSANKVDMLASSTNTTSASMVSGEISLAGAGATVVEAVSGGNAKIDTGNINANNTNLKVDIKRDAKITNNTKAISLAGLDVTNLEAKTTGTSGINTHGTIQNKAANGQAQNVVISTVDNSTATNESANTSIGFVSGSGLNIVTTSDSAITNNIAGIIKAQTLDIDSTLNRTAISNAASKGAGLVGLRAMNLTSQIGNANTTTISATIDAETVDVDSTMTSTVESYVHDFSAGLIALAYGATKNIVQDTAKNIVNFNGSINAGSLDADINTLSNAYLFKESGNYGLFVVKGGELSNTLKATSELNLNNAKIETDDDALFSVVNNANTPSEMQVTDDAGGFVVKDGAQLKNDLDIGASINVNDDTEVVAGDHLDLDITSGTTGFKQKVTSSGSGFAAYNSASSVVGATINNEININNGVLSAKHVDINMNSSNDLSSVASADTHHFAGDPSVNSEVNLTINNTLNVAGELFAKSSDTSVQDTNVNINFMGYSSQTLYQYSNLYIEAAVATGSAKGGINFVTNNKVNVKESGVISSQKDINVVFDKGEENLSSYVAYDKVSRLLFGIPIHDRGQYSSVRNTSNNEAQIDGKLIAGKNNSMHMTIDKDGNATGTINDSLYEKQDSTSVDAGKDSQAAKDEIAKINETLDDLIAEKGKLEKTNETNTTNYENLLEQIEALKLQLAMAKYIQGVAAEGKISESAFKAEIVQMLKDNNVANAENIANQLLDYYTSSSDMPIYSFTTSDGATVVLKYAVDENGNYIKENGNYKFADINGYTISYENGKPVSVTPDGSESVISVGALGFDDYLKSLGVGDKSLSAIKTSLGAMDIDSIEQTIKTDSGSSQEVTFLTTGGKIIYDSTYVDNMQAVDSAITTAENDAKDLNASITAIADNLAYINKQIEENTARKENIAANGLTGLEAQNGSYIFKDLNATSGTINIQANKGTSKVYGRGEVIMSLADVMINNYSNYNLIFNDVTVGGGLGSFVVDGKTVSENPYNGITISTTGTAGNEGGITINNWYDQNDPVNNTAIGVLPSNIIFNGTINTGVGNVNLYNESGDIEINDGIVANTLKVNVAQGSFTQDTKGQEYVLKAGDTLFAGKNINITASKITVEGNMQAGIADKNITITQDMLDNAVNETQKVIVTDADGTTPLKDANGNVQYKEVETGRLLVNLASGRDVSEGTKQSDYMYDKNNIKAIYDPDTNTVELFGVKVTDEANINLTATSSDADAVYVSDKSSIKYANGYGEINIDNQTNANLVVNGLENNKISGAVTYNGSTELPEYGTKIIEETKFGIHQIDKFPYIAIGEYTVETEKTVGFGANQQNTADATLTDGNTTVDTSKNKTGDLIVNGLVSSGNLGVDKAGLLLQTNGNLVINNRVASQGYDYQVPTIDTKGDVVLNKLTDKGGVIIQGLIKNSGSVSVTNNGTEGITVAAKGFIDNTTGNIGLTNNNGVINIAGKINNEGADVVITNDSANGGIITVAGSEIKNNGADINLINNGTKGIETSGNILASKGDINVTNKKGNINFKDGSSIKLNEGYTTQTNNINILNEETAGAMTIAGAINNYGKGNIDIHNKGTGAALIDTTAVISNNNGNMLVTNENSSLTIAGTVSNTSGQTDVTNNGEDGMLISGTVRNGKGVTNIVNNNTSDTSAIKIAATGLVKNDDGTIYIKNYGTKEIGLDIEGIVNAIKQNIEITNENSDIEIGEYDSNNDFYVNAQNGNIIISQKNGDILNGVVDPDTQNKNQNHDLGNKDKAYKTLLTADGNLSMNVEGGNIGADTHALNGKESGFGVNASTRDYTESINVKVNGTVNAKATNNGNALVNIRAKDSDLKVNNITSDGNVMLTAVDWKQADARPTPSDDSYYHGYSIVNAASDKSKANVEGRNISLISSDNLGTKGNAFTYNQLENGSISAMAENDLYIKGMGQNDNLWQLITKRGNMGLEFTGDAIIRELTAGKHLEIVSQGANLTIYDLGKSTNLADTDDILYPHDNILMSSVAPETVDIRVLDTNPDTRVNPNDANSTLNIYNAYIKGQSNGSADVTLRADNIIAHAYDAASSPVSNVARPDGFDATEGRLYANDYMNPDADKNLKATGFNTVGKGGKLVFDIQGVSPDDVVNAGGKESDRNYKPQDVIETVEIFNNPIGFKETVYKAKDVTLSLNSGANAPTDNRGMEISKIYTDNAYVDTKDLNMHISDAFITNYGEFRNGNLGGQGGGHFISDEYRWLTIVDNDYYRNITNNFGIPVTSQLYTKLTGSFALNMGNVIALETKAPVVHYNPYEVILLPRTENSFYRLTYKDDKIQKTTTTPDFADIDKSTYKPTKRDSIRFAVKQGDGYVNIADKKKKKQERKRIIAIENISRGGIAVVHDGSLKKGERFVIDLDYHNIKASPEVEVVRVVNDRAGLKFINMDKATANKILYMNMFTAEAEDQSPQMSKK